MRKITPIKPTEQHPAVGVLANALYMGFSFVLVVRNAEGHQIAIYDCKRDKEAQKILGRAYRTELHDNFHPFHDASRQGDRARNARAEFKEE